MKESKRKKTNFEEYLDMENKVPSAEADAEMERQLAKKLKVKKGRLGGDNDDLNFLLGGSEEEYKHLSDDGDSAKFIGDKDRKKKKKKKKKMLKQVDEDSYAEHGVVSSMEDDCDVDDKFRGNEGVESFEADLKSDIEEKDSIKKEKKIKEKRKVSVVENADVEAPKGRKYVAPHLRACSSNDPNDYTQVRRRIKGILNKLSESNVESTVGELSAVFQTIGRSVASEIISEGVLAHNNEKHAASFAAFVAGLTCMVGTEFGAKLLASLAKSFEDEYLKEDNLSLRKLTLLLSYLYVFGVCSSDLIYDFLTMLTKRLTEVDVSTTLTLLKTCGVKLRGDDPAAMKGFIHGVQSRATELRASVGDENAISNSKRMTFMLETICDIKNNKQKKEELPHHARLKKWLQQLRIDDFAIHGITWSKLLDPEKKGQWWLTGDVASSFDAEEVATTIDKEVLEAQKMLELAASQRMNTDIRKAIFCVIMSGEDYIDAFEKLMRLDLQGKQDREIMRVLLECCLQEKVFNKYYTALAIKLCRHDKNHKFTLQYCLWDQFKELDSMPLVRSMHMAKFLAEMLVSFSLSLAVLKAVDLSDASQLTPKRIMHFRMLFDALFEQPENMVWNVFTRVAVTPELESVRTGMEFFIMEHVLPANQKARQKFKVAKRALNNAEGVLR